MSAAIMLNWPTNIAIPSKEQCAVNQASNSVGAFLQLFANEVWNKNWPAAGTTYDLRADCLDWTFLFKFFPWMCLKTWAPQVTGGFPIKIAKWLTWITEGHPWPRKPRRQSLILGTLKFDRLLWQWQGGYIYIHSSDTPKRYRFGSISIDIYSLSTPWLYCHRVQHHVKYSSLSPYVWVNYQFH